MSKLMLLLRKQDISLDFIEHLWYNKKNHSCLSWSTPTGKYFCRCESVTTSIVQHFRSF